MSWKLKPKTRIFLDEGYALIDSGYKEFNLVCRITFDECITDPVCNAFDLYFLQDGLIVAEIPGIIDADIQIIDSRNRKLADLSDHTSCVLSIIMSHANKYADVVDDNL